MAQARIWRGEEKRRAGRGRGERRRGAAVVEGVEEADEVDHKGEDDCAPECGRLWCRRRGDAVFTSVLLYCIV
jgi:hypothetical protein